MLKVRRALDFSAFISIDQTCIKETDKLDMSFRSYINDREDHNLSLSRQATPILPDTTTYRAPGVDFHGWHYDSGESSHDPCSTRKRRSLSQRATSLIPARSSSARMHRSSHVSRSTSSSSSSSTTSRPSIESSPSAFPEREERRSSRNAFEQTSHHFTPEERQLAADYHCYLTSESCSPDWLGCLEYLTGQRDRMIPTLLNMPDDVV